MAVVLKGVLPEHGTKQKGAHIVHTFQVQGTAYLAQRLIPTRAVDLPASTACAILSRYVLTCMQSSIVELVATQLLACMVHHKQILLTCTYLAVP